MALLSRWIATAAASRGHSTIRDNAAKRLSLRETVGPGAIIYPDAPPEIGWVLKIVGRPTRYLRDRETAIAHYRAIMDLANP